MIKKIDNSGSEFFNFLKNLPFAWNYILNFNTVEHSLAVILFL